MNSFEMFDTIKKLSQQSCERMNEFSKKILRTRGGRIGSGMGALLEALWGYMLNQVISENDKLDCEIAWFPDNQYNDFSCIKKNYEWNPESRETEYFRIEVKSMNIGADESKAHFAAIQKEIEDNDALVIFVWEWKKIDDSHFSPIVIDSFFNRAKDVAVLRDALHIARGGSFVNKNSCPDKCSPDCCIHDGEPLNASGKRERISGPEKTRVSQSVSFAANFGGLVRMIKTDNKNARNKLREIRRENLVADEYISFIHRNYPNEEKNQYTVEELRKVANILGISHIGLTKDDLYTAIRKIPNYQEELRTL